MPATVNHIFTSPIADGTNTQLIRPSDWNSAHNVVLDISGSDISQAFSNGGGVSWGLSANGYVTATVKTDYLTTAMASNRGSDFVQANAVFAGTNASGTIASNGISVSVNAGGGGSLNISAGTTSNNLTALTFNNANGVTFGLNASTITASHNGLTTAMASNASTAFAATGFTTTTIGGAVIAGTHDTAGLKLAVPGYLTTAMLSNAVTLSNINVSAGTTSNNLSALTFSNGSGVSFGLNGSVITATVQTNYLTTAMQSNAATISNINVSAGTTSNNLSALTFSNGSGVSFGLNGSVITATVQTNYLTTAMASNRGSDFVQAGAAFAGTNASGTIASNGISVSVGNYITTARASTDAVGLNTAKTNVTWTVNSAGISLDAGGYAGTGTTFGGTNVSGSMTLNSNGLQLSLSAPTPGGGAAINVSAGTTSGNLQTIQFNNANNHSFGLNGSTITVSYAPTPVSYFANIPIMNNTTTLTVGQSVSHIAPLIVVEDLSFNVIRMIQSGNILAASTTAATTGNATFSCGYTKTHNFVFYSRGVGANSLSLQSYFSTSASEAYSNNIACAANSTQFSYTNRYTFPHSTGTIGFTQDYSSSAASININSASATAFTGFKQIEFQCATTLSGGMWYLAYGQSSSTATQSAGTTIGLRNAVTCNILGVSQNTLQIGTWGAATTNTIGMQLGIGSFSTGGAAGTTNSIGFTAITTTSANNLPYYQLLAIT